jgi:hypothetical protein
MTTRRGIQRTQSPEQAFWTLIVKAMRRLKHGDTSVINGQRVRRLSAARWDVNEKLYSCAFDAATAIRYPNGR